MDAFRFSVSSLTDHISLEALSRWFCLSLRLSSNGSQYNPTTVTPVVGDVMKDGFLRLASPS